MNQPVIDGDPICAIDKVKGKHNCQVTVSYSTYGKEQRCDVTVQDVHLGKKAQASTGPTKVFTPPS